MQGVVKVRVRPNLMDAAIKTLAPLAPAEQLTETDRDEGWLAVHLAADRARRSIRSLQARHLRLRLESGNDLEMLFLELTGGHGPRVARARSSAWLLC